MIKPINITQLNTSKELYYKCSQGHTGTFTLTGIVNTNDNNEAIEDLSDYTCPTCGEFL